MRLHRFYISEVVGSQKEITINSVELLNQVRRVFRLKSGDSIVVFDGSGFDFEATILELRKEVIVLTIGGSKPSTFMPDREIHLYAAVVKKDTFEWIVEKATELGVTHFVPVMAERSEKKALNMTRLNKIALEASEQCGRGDVPVISAIQDLAECLESFNAEETSQNSDARPQEVIVFDIEGKPMSDFDAGLPCVKMFIGPEGGWSPKEVALFHKNNMAIYSLGNQVLRAETAVVAALSLVILGNR